LKIPNLSELRKEYERESNRLPHWARWVVRAGMLLVIWIFAGFFAFPPVIRNQLQKRLTVQLNREVTVGKVRFNPLVLSVTLENFSVAEANGGQFIGWRRLYVNFDAFSFLTREWRFQDIELEGFSGHVAVAKDGKLNFADLLATLTHPSEPNEPPQPTWPLSIRRLAINEAQLNYSDASRAEMFNTVVGPTTISLQDFYTGGPKQAPGEFTATTESGEKFTWRGAVSLSPLKSSGEVELSQFALKKYAPYYADRVRFDLLDGRLSVAFRYEFSLENGKPALRVSEGRAGLKSLKIVKRGETVPVIDLDQVEVTDIAASWPAISADIGRVAVTGGSVFVQRKTEGIDLVELLTPVASEAAPAVSFGPSSSASAVPPPKIKLGGISVRQVALTIEDHTTPRVAQHQLSDLSCDLRNLSLASPNVPMPFGLRAQLAPDGEVHVAGTLTMASMKAELGVELTNVNLANFSPYAETFTNLRVGNGKLTTALYLAVELPSDASPVIAAQGDITVDDFAVFDAAAIDEIASWRSLSLKGFEYNSEPAKLMVSEVNWVEPAGHLIVNADGTTNVALALKPAGAIPEPAVSLPNLPTVVAPPDPTGGMFISMDRLVLEKAAMDFTDRSLQPNVHVSINQLNGEIDGLASSDLARATVDLRGRIDGITPLAISGKINPLSVDAFTDLKVVLKGMELVPVGPYVGKFAGYELNRGSLTLEIKCHINKRKIDCANLVTIDQFTFGQATNSPDATSLPVRLAVALLRDASGRIVLDPPIRGSIDDPDIRTGRVILRVVTNILEKVAKAPFALIGSMFGGGKGEELSFQQFLPGENNPVNEEEIRKLDVVAKALRERPTLRLEIAGGYDEAVDAPVLRGQMLENQMRNIVWNDQRMVDPSLTLDQIQIDPIQRNGMTRRLFYKAFPNEKPKRKAGGGPEEDDEPVAAQRGNLGAFARKKAATVAHTVPPPRPQLTPSGTEKKPDGTVDSSSAVTEVKPPTFDEMRARLLDLITVDEETYRKLAADRAAAVQLYLINYGQVPADRLSLAAITTGRPAAKGARVELRLK